MQLVYRLTRWLSGEVMRSNWLYCDKMEIWYISILVDQVTSEPSGSTWCTLRFPVTYWWSIAARVESEFLRCKSWWKLKIFICPKLKMGREKVLCFQNTSCFLFHLFFFLIGEHVFLINSAMSDWPRYPYFSCENWIYIPMRLDEREFKILSTQMQTSLKWLTQKTRINITLNNFDPHLIYCSLFLKVYANILDFVCWCASKNPGTFSTQFPSENHCRIAYISVCVTLKVCRWIVAPCCFTIEDTG